MNISYTVDTLLYFFTVLIIIRVFLTWIPKLDWDSQPLKMLSKITDWYLDLFKKIIPPVGGIGIHPIVALIVLQLIQRAIVSGLVSAGY